MNKMESSIKPYTHTHTHMCRARQELTLTGTGASTIGDAGALAVPLNVRRQLLLEGIRGNTRGTQIDKWHNMTSKGEKNALNGVGEVGIRDQLHTRKQGKPQVRASPQDRWWGGGGGEGYTRKFRGGLLLTCADE